MKNFWIRTRKQSFEENCSGQGRNFKNADRREEPLLFHGESSYV